jgi:hypothetical protein
MVKICNTNYSGKNYFKMCEMLAVISFLLILPPNFLECFEKNDENVLYRVQSQEIILK